MGERGDAIKMKLRARRLWTQKRTLRCARFLAEQMEIPKRAIVLERGRKSRDKLIHIDGLSEGGVRSSLLRK